MKTIFLNILTSGPNRGAIILITVGLSSDNLIKGKGYFRLIGYKKRTHHLHRRLHYEGPLPPIYNGEKIVFRAIRVKDSEYENLLHNIL
jgi:hypothetical protein